MENSTPVLRTPNHIIIVGCGGVSSFLLPCLLKLVGRETRITLIDGDTLEPRNLDRQLFKPEMIGQNKAEALFETLNLRAGGVYSAVPDYFTVGQDVPEGCLILCCADNHAARRAVLEAADNHTGHAIIGGNEYTDAEAYYYRYDWRETERDPRIYYPTIMTDDSGDPTRPIGCQGEAQVENRQLALANFSAANHMLWLLWFYFAEAGRMDVETAGFWPVRHQNTFTRMTTTLQKDLKKGN